MQTKTKPSAEVNINRAALCPHNILSRYAGITIAVLYLGLIIAQAVYVFLLALSWCI
jgi:hypothetical protein